MKVKPKNKAKPDIPAAAMSDIAFLLIIFFILTTQFQKKGIEMELPSVDKEKKSEEQSPTLILMKNGMQLNGGDVAPDELKGKLIEMLKNKKDPGKRVVVIQAMNDSDYELFVKAVDSIRGADATPTIEVVEDRKGPASSG